MSKTSQHTENQPSGKDDSSQSPGSARGCQWLADGNHRDLCGKPATSKHVKSDTYYCKIHAQWLAATVGGVHKIVPPNAQAEPLPPAASVADTNNL